MRSRHQRRFDGKHFAAADRVLFTGGADYNCRRPNTRQRRHGLRQSPGESDDGEASAAELTIDVAIESGKRNCVVPAARNANRESYNTNYYRPTVCSKNLVSI